MKQSANPMLNHVLVTGGAGFIGSNFILKWLATEDSPVVNLDKLTYAGNLMNLEGVSNDPRHLFVKGDINDRELLRGVFDTYRPRAVLHFAAESHVDRSLLGPEAFISTNLNGTFCLLDESRRYWDSLPAPDRAAFRFLHVSTDEVYGSLSPEDPPFTENSLYAPNSPYAASKAGSDHLVRAYHHSYGLPTLTTNCSNNYGPFQFPEKLIPLMILNAMRGVSLPVYGDGLNVRDWIFVEDHCEGIRQVMQRGRVGESYNIGGQTEKTNIEVVQTICSILDEVHPMSDGRAHSELITYVKDRPGHDRRYAIDSRKVQAELGWEPRESFDSGIRKTVLWYLSNLAWAEHVNNGSYREWLKVQYANS